MAFDVTLTIHGATIQEVGELVHLADSIDKAAADRDDRTEDAAAKVGLKRTTKSRKKAEPAPAEPAPAEPKEAKAEPTPEPEPEPQAETTERTEPAEPEAVTRNVLVKFARKVARQADTGSDLVHELLTEYGTDRIKNLTDEQIAPFYAQLKERSEELPF